MNKYDKNEMSLIIVYYVISIFSVLYLGFTIFMYNNIAVTISIILMHFIVNFSMIITDLDMVTLLPCITNFICSIGLFMTISM